MEERIKELFSNEEYVNGLFELDSYEAAAAKLAEDGVEVSAEELKNLVAVLKKKEAGEITDEELEGVAGGLCIISTIILGIVGTAAMGGFAYGMVKLDAKQKGGKC